MSARQRLLHLPLLLIGLLRHVAGGAVDARVEDEEHDDGDVEIADDEEGVEERLLEELHGTFARLQVPVADEVLPAHDGGEEEREGNDPGEGDQPEDLAAGAPVSVARRVADAAVAVDGDGEDGVDGDEADGVVGGQPEVAGNGTQVPATHQLVDGVEGHADDADAQVGDGQRGDEVVGRLADGPLHEEGRQHEDVAEDGDDDADGDADADEDRQPEVVAKGELRGVQRIITTTTTTTFEDVLHWRCCVDARG